MMLSTKIFDRSAIRSHTQTLNDCLTGTTKVCKVWHTHYRSVIISISWATEPV